MSARVKGGRCYHVCGVMLDSNVSLPELEPADGNGLPDLVVRVRRGCVARADPASWFHEYRLDDGTVWLAVGRRLREYVLRFPGLADFALSLDGRAIHGFREPRIPDETIQHLLVDHVLPLALSRRRGPVLHASAVVINGEAVAFLGDPGRGKSTLAASFCTAGHTLLTDDCLVLQADRARILAVPSYRGLRLWSDSMTAFGLDGDHARRVAHDSSKRRWPRRRIPRFAANPAMLSRLYVLDARDGWNGEPRVDTVSGPRAFMEVVRHANRLDPLDGSSLKIEFDRIGRLADRVPVRRLVYPRRLDALGAVRAAVVADVSAT